MPEEKLGDGASLSVGPDHVQAQVSERVLAKLGDAAAWLFPRRDARVRITAALAHRVSEKIAIGGELDQQERNFVSSVFDKEGRALSNREAVADRVNKVFPEVAAQMKALPISAEQPMSKRFIARAESIASEASEEEICDIFARLLAGEISRPGSISLRTLEAVHLLDQKIAKQFDIARRLALDNTLIFMKENTREVITERGLDTDTFLELMDAGLVDPIEKRLFVKVGHAEQDHEWQYHDRVLRIHSKKTASVSDISFVVRRLTRTGREIASVLPVSPDEEYFQECCSLFARSLGTGGEVTWKYTREPEWRKI